jgi:hypothetical protein
VPFYPHFYGPSFFGLDEMHLFGQNLAKRIRDYFVPSTSKFSVRVSRKPVRFYPFALDRGVTLGRVGDDMVRSRSGIPLQHFDGNWGNIVARSNARAVGWLVFLLYVVPTLLIPQLVSRDAKKALNNLIMACHISLRWEVRPGDADFVHG